MGKKEEWMKEEYQDMIKDIESNSPYKRNSSPQKKWMSVTEMGELLGLKKTDRYWLLHKNVFESREIAGKRISCRPAMIIKNLLWKKMLLWQISEERNFYNPGIEDAMEILII